MLNLAFKPTPLHRLERLSGELGINLWVKRDDLTGDLLTGGNKIRKLEFILENALAEGADTILVAGGLQSNLVKAAAALALRVGLKPVLVLLGAEPEHKMGNLFLDTLMGTDIVYTEGSHPAVLEEKMQVVAGHLRNEGRKPYIIPFGASNGLGTLGYVRAYEEMNDQLKALDLSFDWQFVSAGSGGTLAGIVLGSKLCHARTNIIGISPWLSKEEVEESVLRCIAEAEGLMKSSPGENPDTLNPLIEERFIGTGYGIPTSECIAAISYLAQREGILLDQTYTGKAMAGLMAYVREGKIKQGETVLFWHTGGVPGLFNLAEAWPLLKAGE